MNNQIIDLSKIRLGSMMNSLRVDENECLEIISRAYQIGIKNIDISPSYISGRSIRLTSKIVNLLRKKDIKIHTKVGSRYKENQLKNLVYLSKIEINESIHLVKKLFPNNPIETVMIHINSTEKIIRDSLIFLNDLRDKKFFRNFGICDFEDKYINKLVIDMNLKEFYVQKRYCLNILKSQNNPKIKYIAYGLLNAGSILNRSKGRIETGLDANEIKDRNTKILNSKKFNFIKEKCRHYDLSLVDYSIACPLLSFYEGIVIGPTKLSHLDCIERMLDKDYWARIKHLHNIICDLDK